MEWQEALEERKGLKVNAKKTEVMMYLSSYVNICDIDHQNSMTEINSFYINS